MTTPFVGQVQPFAFNFAPRNWAMCNGQLLSVSQNAALFALLGTMYGGNGVSTFALPNLQSRVPVHTGILAGGATYVQGTTGGLENVGLTLNELPAHNHVFSGASALADKFAPAAQSSLAATENNAMPGTPGDNFYGTGSATALTPASVQAQGGGVPHNNLQPYLVINWCIATSGAFPSRN